MPVSHRHRRHHRSSVRPDGCDPKTGLRMIEGMSSGLLHCGLRLNGMAFGADTGSTRVALGSARKTAIRPALVILEAIETWTAGSLGRFGSDKCGGHECAAGNCNHDACSHGGPQASGTNLTPRRRRGLARARGLFRKCTRRSFYSTIFRVTAFGEPSAPLETQGVAPPAYSAASRTRSVARAEAALTCRGGPIKTGWNSTAATIVQSSASAIILPMLDMPG